VRRSVSDAAYFILDGSTTAGIPVDDGFRGLSTMAAGDFFGEIAALTGSRRTANVVADKPTMLLEVPASTLRSASAGRSSATGRTTTPRRPPASRA